ncbi:hypothetical protein AB0M45_33125 [Nocardia sp. NPDC051787]|uniref:hypothetical protein n=1 Tax=Nocardia sp. NPDC051787 TaxID=3155415 RepID=UPI0034429A63
MPTALNLPLAALVLNTLRAHPHLHDRNVWAEARADGVAHCVAGWTVTLAGAEWGSFPGMVTWRGRLRAIPVLAGELLGISDSEARMLMYDCNEEQAVALLDRWIFEACADQYIKLCVLEQDCGRAS